MERRKKHKVAKKKRSAAPPNLKSASGAGISFEDKVAAFLFCEMLSGKSSLGARWGIVERIERQAADWGPFDDLLLTVPNQEAAVTLCRDILAPSDSGNNRPRELWKELLDIARELRDVGGSVTRERLASKLRNKFRLRDDPSDVAAWSSIRGFTKEWIGQIETTLTGGLTLPRKADLDELRKNLAANRASHVIGESGSGKSALMKALATENAASPSGAEIVWVKADQFPRLLAYISDFNAVLLRTRLPSALLVFDALDACYSDETLTRIGQTIAALTSDVASPWKVVLICQTPEWSRVLRRLVKTIAGHNALTKRFQCGEPWQRKQIAHQHLFNDVAGGFTTSRPRRQVSAQGRWPQAVGRW